MDDHKEELTFWAINNFKTNLEIIEQRWNIFEKQPYFDYKVQILINSQKYEGRGTSLSQKDALNAAIGESLERFTIDFNNIPYSNGCSLHSNLEIALEKSKYELIERHFVMLFTLGYWNKEIITSPYPDEIVSIINFLQSKDINIEFYSLNSSNSHHVILCQANGLNSSPSFGLVFGSSCNNNQQDSIIKSFKEVLVNIVAYFNNNITSISHKDFLLISNYTPINHLELYLNNEFAKNYLKNRIFKKHNFKVPFSENFTSEILQSPFSSLFHVIRSTHSKCLSPQWGPMPKKYPIENINPNFPFVLP